MRGLAPIACRHSLLFQPSRRSKHVSKELMRSAERNTVRQTQNGEALTAQPIVAFRVAPSLRRLSVNTSVEFDNQFVFGTTKIDDEFSNWVLPAEYDAVFAEAAKDFPRRGLSFGGRLAQHARSGDLARVAFERTLPGGGAHIVRPFLPPSPQPLSPQGARGFESMRVN